MIIVFFSYFKCKFNSMVEKTDKLTTQSQSKLTP